MPFTEVKCPKCRSVVPVEQGQTTAFCVRCGEKLTEISTDEQKDIIVLDRVEDWDKLFDEGKYSDIIDAAEFMRRDPNNAGAKVFYTLASMAQQYNNYVDDICRDDAEKGAFAKIFSALGGGGSDRAIHGAFMKNLISLTGELPQLLSEQDDENLNRIAAARAIEIIIRSDLGRIPQSVSVAFEMLEKQAIPLFRYLSDGELEKVFKLYGHVGERRYHAKEVMRAIKKEKEKR